MGDVMLCGNARYFISDSQCWQPAFNGHAEWKCLNELPWILGLEEGGDDDV